MPFEWRFSSETVDWDELSNLYLVAPLGRKAAADLKISFSNSMFKCFVYDTNRLIAVGRGLADGIDCSYLCDIAVHSDYQGIGLGKEVVRKLVEFSKGHRKIILYAAPGKEPFYRKLGFKRMTTAMAIFRDEGSALVQGLVVEE